VDAARTDSSWRLLRRAPGLNMSAGKAMSVRLPAGLAEELAALARVEDVSPSELVRAAIQHFIATRPSDPEFKERLKKRLEEDAEILKRFSE
jgi:hypothetical protein